jgi:hypothetical protein
MPLRFPKPIPDLRPQAPARGPRGGSSPTYASIVLEDAPLLFWRFDEDAGAVVDSSGNGRDGTAQGAITRAAAPLLPSGDGASADFLAGNGVAYRAAAAWMQTPDFSIEGWVRRDTNVALGYIASREDGTGDNGWALRFDAGILRFYVQVGTDWGTGAGIAVALATTVHVAATHDGITSRLYVNGAQVSTEARAGDRNALNAMRLTVGNWGNLGALTRGFDGRVDELAFYGTALSADRIAAHYAARNL